MPRGRLLRHALDPNYAVKGDVSQKGFQEALITRMVDAATNSRDRTFVG
jgi:hypothetical protein